MTKDEKNRYAWLDAEEVKTKQTSTASQANMHKQLLHRMLDFLDK